MRRWALLIGTPVLSIFAGATAIAVITALTANACPGPAAATDDQPSPAAIREIPAQLLPIYQQVGAHYAIPWELLAGIATEECSQGRLQAPSCTLRPAPPAPASRTPPAPPA